MALLTDLRSLTAALWLGAAIYFSAAVAPSAFVTTPTRETAGAIVSRTLMLLNYSGFAIGLVLLLSSFVKSKTVARLKLWGEQLFLLIFTAACAFGQFVIAGKMQVLREQIGRPIDEIAADDPLRIAFNDLHGYSVGILLTAMIAAFVSYFFLTSRARKNYIR